MQEAVRKDVERCFGVLQARFGVLTQPGRLWDREMIQMVWYACVIMHNMIIEDQENNEVPSVPIPPNPTTSSPFTFDQLLVGMASIQDETKHFALKKDLISHLWNARE
jgi:Plant transposon protein